VPNRRVIRSVEIGLKAVMPNRDVSQPSGVTGESEATDSSALTHLGGVQCTPTDSNAVVGVAAATKPVAPDGYVISAARDAITRIHADSDISDACGQSGERTDPNTHVLKGAGRDQHRLKTDGGVLGAGRLRWKC